MTDSTATVAALHVYPVKACAATDLNVGGFGPRGIAGDRAFALIDADHEVITQRQHPVLATVRPAFDGTTLTLRTAEHPDHVVELDEDGQRRPVTVHGRPCAGRDQGGDAAAWFAEIIGAHCRLVWCPPDGGKAINPKYGVAETAFADAYPVTIVSTASLRRLDDEILGMGEDPVPMDRFRPNVVVTGWAEPHHEDSVAGLRFGDVEVRMTKRDDRCVVTTVDQSTGERTRQPLRALGHYRVIDQAIMFGVFGVVARTGTARVGDVVSEVGRV